MGSCQINGGSKRNDGTLRSNVNMALYRKRG